MAYSKIKRQKNRSQQRDAIPFKIKVQVLTEAGYRCGVPACRGILALDLHHMVEVSAGGKDAAENLLPLCPTCHALFHRGTIKRESIFAWKAILVSLTRAFDVLACDQLLFLAKPETNGLRVTGDGVLTFARLIFANLVTFELSMQNGPLLLYAVKLTAKGLQFVSAWSAGNEKQVKQLIGG